MLEREIAFDMELSVICARDAGGAIAFYDLPQNIHRGGILRESVAPAPISDEIGAAARDYAGRIAEALDYVGVLAVEMFLTEEEGTPRLLINEIAPRVHNSGHWTIEACAVSQFENHIRAVAGWPLGSTRRHSDARLVNLLGEDANRWPELLEANPGALNPSLWQGRGAPRTQDGPLCGYYPTLDAELGIGCWRDRHSGDFLIQDKGGSGMPGAYASGILCHFFTPPHRLNANRWR